MSNALHNFWKQAADYFLNKASIHELTQPPKIGQTYSVPCFHNIPVMGPVHHDKELNNPTYHVHIDFRFVTENELCNATRFKLENSLNTCPKFIPNIQVVRNIPALTVYDKNPVFTYQDRMCLREQLDLRGYESSVKWTLQMYIPDEPTMRGLEDLMENTTLNLKPLCKVCPHKGMPLDTAPVFEDTIVCPGHGLQWCNKTGKLVRRTGKQGKHIYKHENEEKKGDPLMGGKSVV